MTAAGRALEGIKVVELGVVMAGPAAAAILADWGASVIKIEPPEGDPQRGNLNKAYFELDNRGKRSMCLDLKSGPGRTVIRRLTDDADVFVSNLRTGPLRRLGLDYETLSASNPRLVYASITGYGYQGPGAGKAGYDIGAYWSRAGLAMALTPRGEVPPVARPGMGDHTTGLAAAAGVAAALYARERTGRGQHVTTSLLRAGTYTLSSDLASALQGFAALPGMRRMQFNPLLGVYKAADERWFWLLGVQATRHWPAITRVIGRPELAADSRFSTLDAMIRNRREVMAILDESFAAHPMSYWTGQFDAEDIWWDPVQTLGEAIEDPMIEASGAFPDIDDGHGRTVATPVDFIDAPLPVVGRAPEAGEHTEQILLELGYDWPAIEALRQSQAIP
jgi:crotonobetainyl-CoA:carnitine CoA-transferase CaiB-like acyl-CoA transferase